MPVGGMKVELLKLEGESYGLVKRVTTVGVDSEGLVKLSQWIRESKFDIRSLVVVKDGKIVFERYSSGLTRDNNYELYSITKPITAMLASNRVFHFSRLYVDAIRAMN
jgi:Beta-lactamase